MEEAMANRPMRHVGRLGAGPLPHHHTHPTAGLNPREHFGTTLPDAKAEDGTLLLKTSLRQRGRHNTYDNGKWIPLSQGEGEDGSGAWQAEGIESEETSGVATSSSSDIPESRLSKDGHPIFRLDAKNKPRRFTGY